MVKVKKWRTHDFLGERVGGIRGLLVFVILIAIGISFASLPVAALHWVPDTNVSVGPTQSKASRTTTFEVTVSYSGTSLLTVSEVDIAFQWDPTTWRISSGSTNIPSGGSQTWSVSEAIPALQPGFYSNTVTVTAKTSGDFYASPSDWSGNLQILANVPPVAAFGVSPSNADTNSVVQFTDQSSDTDGSVVAWHWDFGDGSNANVQNPTHQFISAGVYHVALTVTDNNGATSSVTQNVQVVSAPIGGGPRIAGLGAVEWGIVAVVIVAVAVLAATLVRIRRKRPRTTSPPMQRPPQIPPPP